MINLYKVSMSKKPARAFFVVAKDEAKAARAAEKQWNEWDYTRASAVTVDLIAEGRQYPWADGVGYLIVEDSRENANE